MSSQPVPTLTQAGSGHWRCPLQYEDEKRREWVGDERGKGGNSEVVYIQIPTQV